VNGYDEIQTELNKCFIAYGKKTPVCLGADTPKFWIMKKVMK